MTRIFLIRHGETDWNISGRIQGYSDVELSKTGICQARLLKKFPFPDIDAIYSSDLSRAFITAKILSERFNISINVSKNFREINFGNWEGQFIRDLIEKNDQEFKKVFTHPEEVLPPNGETFAHCQMRVMTELKKIISKHENQQILIVAHGGVNRLIICSILKVSIQQIWALEQSNTAVNIFRVDDNNFTIELLNSTIHLCGVF